MLYLFSSYVEQQARRCSGGHETLCITVFGNRPMARNKMPNQLLTFLKPPSRRVTLTRSKSLGKIPDSEALIT